MSEFWFWLFFGICAFLARIIAARRLSSPINFRRDLCLIAVFTGVVLLAASTPGASFRWFTPTKFIFDLLRVGILVALCVVAFWRRRPWSA